jgi:cytochrome c553
MTPVSIRKLLACGAMAACAVAMNSAARADVEAGHAKVKQICAACHGEQGNKPLQPEYPILAGQHADYLLKALHDYKNKARKNVIMQAQVQSLSEQDMHDVAEYFAAQQGPLHVKR